MWFNRLRQKLAEKRAGTSEQEKIDKKRNEEIRRKSTKETQDIKEDMKKKEKLKEGVFSLMIVAKEAKSLKLPRKGKKSKRRLQPSRG